MTARSALRWAHLVLGLVGGFSVAVAGLTGSAPVYRAEVDRLLNPGLHRVDPSGTPAPLEEIRAAVEAGGGPPLRLILPATAPGRSMIAVLVGKGPEDRWEVFVDPATAAILGRRRLDRAWTHQLEKLDLHRSVGIVTLAPSLVLALSGSMLVFRPYILPVLNLATGPMPLEKVPRSGPKQTTPPPTLDFIRDRAAEAFPDATLTRIYTPEGPDGTFAVRLRLPEESSPHGDTAMRFDRHTGATLQVHSSGMATPAQHLLWYAAYPWHTGDALGPAGRAFAALSGLGPPVLLASGLIWWRRRAGRRATDAARPSEINSV